MSFRQLLVCCYYTCITKMAKQRIDRHTDNIFAHDKCFR